MGIEGFILTTTVSSKFTHIGTAHVTGRSGGGGRVVVHGGRGGGGGGSNRFRGAPAILRI